MKKRIVSFILAVAMILPMMSSISITALAKINGKDTDNYHDPTIINYNGEYFVDYVRGKTKSSTVSQALDRLMSKTWGDGGEGYEHDNHHFRVGNYTSSGHCYNHVSEVSKVLFDEKLPGGFSGYSFSDQMGNWSCVGKVTGTEADHYDKMLTLISQCQAGDVIAYKSSKTVPQHIVMIYSHSGNEYTIYESTSPKHSETVYYDPLDKKMIQLVYCESVKISNQNDFTTRFGTFTESAEGIAIYRNINADKWYLKEGSGTSTNITATFVDFEINDITSKSAVIKFKCNLTGVMNDAVKESGIDQFDANGNYIKTFYSEQDDLSGKYDYFYTKNGYPITGLNHATKYYFKIYAKINGTKYYSELKNFTTTGSHTFDQKNTDSKYLKSAATCTSAAVYYYSCSCGEKGTSTFKSGSALGHSYDTFVYCSEEHPHYKCYQCKCGDIFVNTKEPTYLSSCRECNIPGKPALTGLKEQYHTGDTVIFLWSVTKYTTHYNLRVYKKDETGAYKSFLFDRELKSPSISHDFEEGEYRATLYSYNRDFRTEDNSDWIHTASDNFYFTVTGHVYDNDCDTTCNICGATRTVAGHVYDNDCDTACNICGATRTVAGHIYDAWSSDDKTHWHQCKSCGEKTDTASHIFTEKVIDPTPDAQGYTEHTCECGYSYKDKYTEYINVDINAPQIVFESLKSRKGTSVTVKVGVKNNPGFSAASFMIEYDDTRLELVGACLGADFESGASVSYDNLPYLTFVRNKNVLTDSDFLYITFNVKENAELGKAAVSLSYNKGDISNTAEADVDFYVQSGSIEVIEYMPGDINDDGSVNTKDLTRLLKYLNHENVSVNEAALDVNNDGSVNTKDLTRLLKYLNHESVEIY